LEASIDLMLFLHFTCICQSTNFSIHKALLNKILSDFN